MKPTSARKISTHTLIMMAAWPRAGVAAYWVVSGNTCQTCQCWRMPLRAKPISPISQVNVTARMNSAYCERGGIFPHWIVPSDCAPRPMTTSMIVTNTIHESTAPTW